MLLPSAKRHTVRAPHAFTLLEILVVAAIVTMLAGAGIYYFVNQLDDAKVSAKIDCKGLAEQVEIFNTKHNRYPTGVQELTQETDGMKRRFRRNRSWTRGAGPIRSTPRASAWSSPPRTRRARRSVTSTSSRRVWERAGSTLPAPFFRSVTHTPAATWPVTPSAPPTRSSSWS